MKLEFHFAAILFVLACLLAALSRDFFFWFCLGAGFGSCMVGGLCLIVALPGTPFARLLPG
jgi:hypothetical protein